MEKTKVAPMQNQVNLDKLSQKLTGKFGRKKSEPSASLTKTKTKAQKIWSYVGSGMAVVFIVTCIIICVSSFCNIFNKSPNMIFGYSALQISSGSMTADSIEIGGKTYDSGFAIGDNIVIHPVDTHTLRIGDKIAFYAYPENYLKYHSLRKEEIQLSDQPVKYKVSFGQFWGFHTKDVTEASTSGSMLVFHHITNAYMDENGKYWFKTQGSANAVKDSWFISEEMIVGIYDESAFGHAILSFILFLSSESGFIMFLLIPIIILIVLLIQSVWKHLYLSLLELDVVEQKRKITDDICVKNKLGFFMETTSKYKVLSQATKKEIPTYVKLLWPDGNEPYALNKYVHSKRLIMYPMKKLLKLNQLCEARYKEGENIKKIASFYNEQRQLIKRKEQMIKNRLKMAHELVSERRRVK
jgi:hypothetical protein